MFRSLKNQTAPISNLASNFAANLAATSSRSDLPTVAAAWPATVSPLARVIAVFRHSETGAEIGTPADASSLPTFRQPEAGPAAPRRPTNQQNS
jgi:hypothetical protein